MELKCHLLCFNILKEIQTSARELEEKSTEVHRRLSQKRWGRAMVLYEKGNVILKLSILAQLSVMFAWLLEFGCVQSSCVETSIPIEAVLGSEA